MDKTQQTQGNFVINLNFRRNTNPKAPPITGRISTPEDPETDFTFPPSTHDRNGESYFIGPVDMNRSMRHALNRRTPSKAQHFIAIRENGFKIFKHHHDAPQTPNTPHSPKPSNCTKTASPPIGHLDTHREGTATPCIRLGTRPTRYGPWASGNTQHPLTKEQAAALTPVSPTPLTSTRRNQNALHPVAPKRMNANGPSISRLAC